MTDAPAYPPLITVIMPVWQPRADWLEAAIDSVLGQRGCRLELIVVDDGCADPVSRLLSSCSDQRIRLIRIGHGGQAEACNAGIAHARGAWIRFVDPDDVLPSDSTAHLISLMDGDRLIAYGATLDCDDALRPRGVIASSLQGDVVADCLLARFHARHPALLFPRRVIELAGGWENLGVSSDWDFVLRALDHAPVRGDRTIVLHYRRHAGSMTGAATMRAAEESWRRIVARYFLRHPEQRWTHLERLAWATLYGTNARRYVRAGRYGCALDRFGRAAWWHPRTALRETAAFMMPAPIPPIVPTVR